MTAPASQVPAGPTRISAIILTLNEERFIERCVRSLQGVADDIVVVDSGSTDRTREIAQLCGARVVDQPWLGWIGQRGRGIKEARHDWVLIIEADEIITPPLAAGLRDVLRGPMNPEDGYSLDRRDDFLGALLPSMRRRSKRLHFIRLFNRTRSGYDPTLIIHEEVRITGRALPLPGVIIHWRGMTVVDQVARYAQYAPLEAEVLLSRGQRIGVLSLLVRPVLRFGWCYLVCGGFRLGARGFAHALMVASSEYLRFAGAWERQNAPATLDPPAEVLARFTPASGATGTAAAVTTPARSSSSTPLHDGMS
jgi:glycosyltransferase involved in cell wall biosynthesis